MTGQGSTARRTRRYFFRVEYDGGRYAGWQSQKNAPTIQDHLQRAFSTVTRSSCPVTGAGRTDAGVHARAQGAHVDAPCELDPAGTVYAVNAVLPPDIAVFDLKEVSPSFHARYSALRRRYVYRIVLKKAPLSRNRAWCVTLPVNWNRVRRNAAALAGRHDFTTFCSANTSTDNMVCTVYEASLHRHREMYFLTIEADRFVYKMVRSIVGTLVDIGRGRIQRNIEELIEARCRGEAGETAPPRGLTLESVTYPEIA